jgi:hypothetical protein
MENDAVSELEGNETTKIGPSDKVGEKNMNRPSYMGFLFSFSTKLSSSKYLKWFVVALLPILIFLRYPVDRVDYDLWWHMALGKYYIANHTLVMDHSVFSWTPTDPTWIYNTCLGSIAMYLFYSLAGGFGLWIFQWTVFVGIFVSFYLFLRLLGQRLDVTNVTVMAMIGIACSLACRFYKPELFSALMFSWLLFIYFYVKETRKKNTFYFYPLLFALWANLHGIFVVGFVLLAIVLVGEILNRIFFAKESFTTNELIHFAMAGLLSMAATLINPYGVEYLLSTYRDISSETYAGLQNQFVLAWQSLWPYLTEGSEIFLLNGIAAWIMTTMMISIFILSGYEFIKKKSCDFALLLASMALYWKGMETVRVSYLFAISFFFVFFHLVFRRLKLKTFPEKSTAFSLVIFLLFFINVAYFNIRYTPYDARFGEGLDDIVPVKEVQFLKKYKMEGLLFNDYVVGGYLMWALYPEYKNFIDPRSSPYRNQVLPDYMEFCLNPVNRESIERFRTKYPFKIIMLHYRQMVLIFDFLKSEGEEWRLLYFEKNAAILIHKSLLPIIKTEAGNVNLSPLRFRGVKNPDILLNVFNFYLHLDPRAGRYIYDVFKKNVSDYYKLKPEILSAMDRGIRTKEIELESKTRWLSP